MNFLVALMWTILVWAVSSDVFAAAAPASDEYEYFDDKPENLGSAQREKAEKDAVDVLSKLPQGFTQPIALIKEEVLSPGVFLSFLLGKKGIPFGKSIVMVPSEGEGSEDNMKLASLVMEMSEDTRFTPSKYPLFPGTGVQGKIMMWRKSNNGKETPFKVFVVEACSFERLQKKK